MKRFQLTVNFGRTIGVEGLLVDGGFCFSVKLPRGIEPLLEFDDDEGVGGVLRGVVDDDAFETDGPKKSSSFFCMMLLVEIFEVMSTKESYVYFFQ